MATDFEKKITQELAEVSARLEVPDMPEINSGLVLRTDRRAAWQPVIAAAAVVAVIASLTFALSQFTDPPTPAPPAQTPDPTPTPRPSPPDPTPDNGTKVTIANSPPTLAYLLEGQLVVNGVALPGLWWTVEPHGDSWVGLRSDSTWWFGTSGSPAQQIVGRLEQPPVLSASGRYLAYVAVEGDRGKVRAAEISPDARFTEASSDVAGVEGGVATRVRAVTDEGSVIVQGRRTSLLWRLGESPPAFVDLNETAPNQQFLGGTSAGLVVVDESSGVTDAASTAPYLADISEAGLLTQTGLLPTYDAIAFSPGGSWLVRSPAGTLGGEVQVVNTLTAQAVDSSAQVIFEAPRSWDFLVNTWAWEDEQNLLVALLPRQGTAERLARCNTTAQACRVLTRSTQPPDPRSASPEAALAAVVEAVVAADRGSLAAADVVDDRIWKQLRTYAAGQSGAALTCRDNGSGTRDCEMLFDASPETTFYAILEPAQNAYGWRVTYASVASE